MICHCFCSSSPYAAGLAKAGSTCSGTRKSSGCVNPLPLPSRQPPNNWKERYGYACREIRQGCTLHRADTSADVDLRGVSYGARRLQSGRNAELSRRDFRRSCGTKFSKVSRGPRSGLGVPNAPADGVQAEACELRQLTLRQPQRFANPFIFPPCHLLDCTQSRLHAK